MRLNIDYLDLDPLLEKLQETLPHGEKLTRTDVKQFKAIFFRLAEISNNGWICVTDGLPHEHDSLFAKNPHLSKYMWSKESNDVIVYVVFPDGTGRATEGRIHDGKWHTKISPVLEPVVTHWMKLPEPPKT